jgi:FAD/FMN-containing dehydrogenase
VRQAGGQTIATNGTISHQHGVGDHAPYLAREALAMDTLQALSRLDPAGD